MMSIESFKKAHELLSKIKETERLIAAYRAAKEVIVGLPCEHLVPQNTVTLTAAEIGDHIVGSLARRVALMREELAELGVE